MNINHVLELVTVVVVISSRGHQGGRSESQANNTDIHSVYHPPPVSARPPAEIDQRAKNYFAGQIAGRRLAAACWIKAAH
jgi:hypothetical protein